MPMTTLTAGNSSASRARQAAESWRASIAGPMPFAPWPFAPWPYAGWPSGAVVTTTTSDSRAETIASGARVATKCSMLSQIRCRWAALSWGAPSEAGRSNAIATTLWSRAGS